MQFALRKQAYFHQCIIYVDIKSFLYYINLANLKILDTY